MAYKILLIPSWFPSSTNPGLGIFFLRQAEALAARGHDVTVLSIQLRSLLEVRNLISSGYGFLTEKVNGVKVIKYVGVSFPNRFPAVNAWFWAFYGRILFRKYLKSFGIPDLIHVHAMIYGGVLALRIHEEYGVPYVLTEHSSIYKHGFANDTHIRFARAIARRSSHNFAVSEDFRRSLTERVGDFNWEYLPNIVGHEFLSAKLNNKINSNKDILNFFAVGGLMKHKRVDLLINAFSLALQKDPDLQLKIIGDGPEKNSLLNLTRDLGVAHRIQFLGRKDTKDLVAVASACDVFVHASDYETFGVAIIEALAMGKPVISTRSGGPECIVNENVGLLVAAGDVTALANAILSMRLKLNHYDSLTLRQYCESKFSENVILTRLEYVYAHLRKGLSQTGVNLRCK